MNTDDPRLTAYALGELTGSERKAFEAELALSEDLQRELIAITRITDMITQLPTNPDAQFDSERRQALKKKIAGNLAERRAETRRRRQKLLIGAITGTAAACLLFTLVRPEISGALTRADMKQLAERENKGTPPGGPAAQISEESNSSVASAKPVAASAPLEGQLAAATASTEQIDARQLAMKAPLPTVGNGVVARKLFADTDAARGVDLLAKSKKGELVISTNGGFNTEAYDSIQENIFLAAKDNPLSTFSIDVDTASYANVRRFLQAGQRPPAGAIRMEELINYFTYDLPQSQGDVPFSVTTDVTQAPWNTKHLLARIALKGRDIERSKMPPSNLVFLVDVSGSMNEPNKLPLLKQSLLKLVDELRDRDRVALVTYAGSTSVVLPSTSGENKAAIRSAIEQLGAGGSTNGASGIQLAYQTAREQFLKEGNNRVLLCTDGDLNVGITNQSDLVDLIEQERKSGVFLSVLGFGTGNYKDSTLEKLADKGNGNYGYIDSPSEGRKVLVEQMGGTLFTIAKDVKIQVEFNPATVAGYRLIGYENRLLAKEDFNDDTKDAGEIGAGHTVTALYEIVPAGLSLPENRTVDPLKYQSPAPVMEDSKAMAGDLFTVKLRYKAPTDDVSKLIEKPIRAEAVDFAKAPEDVRFASAVAAFSMKLRGSPDAGDLSWEDIRKIARDSLGEDKGSYRAEFLTLIEKAGQLPAVGEQD